MRCWCESRECDCDTKGTQQNEQRGKVAEAVSWRQGESHVAQQDKLTALVYDHSKYMAMGFWLWTHKHTQTPTCAGVTGVASSVAARAAAGAASGAAAPLFLVD